VVLEAIRALYAAKALARSPAQVTLVDKRNFHPLSTLSYQVATGESLAGRTFTYPCELWINRHKIHPGLKAEAVDLLPDQNKVILLDGELSYDTLILATGAGNYYWSKAMGALAPGLKTIEDVPGNAPPHPGAFEHAEERSRPRKQRA